MPQKAVETPYLLSRTEEMIMLATIGCGKDVSVRDIMAVLERILGRPPSLSALYLTLDRLTKNKMLTVQVGKPLARRGGRAPLRYTVTPAGNLAIATTAKTTASLMAHADLRL